MYIGLLCPWITLRSSFLFLVSIELTVRKMVEDWQKHKELIDKTEEFLEKHRPGRCKVIKLHRVPIGDQLIILGIQFTYSSIFEESETIDVDLFLMPKFANQEELLTSLRTLPEEQRTL